jgi:hypothetical protein
MSQSPEHDQISPPGPSDAPGPPDDPRTGSRYSAFAGGPSIQHKLSSAFKDVEHHRRLVKKDAKHTICLAAALDHLSELLADSGRANEALSFSQEATGLYRALAEKQTGVYYTLPPDKIC